MFSADILINILNRRSVIQNYILLTYTILYNKKIELHNLLIMLFPVRIARQKGFRQGKTHSVNYIYFTE